MKELHALLGVVASSGSSSMDWVYGTVASVVFVALVAIPAAVLNVRDRKRRESAGGQ